LEIDQKTKTEKNTEKTKKLNKYSKLRKVLIDNYNVTDVISVPQNAFENTGTKTSIIIFHNNQNMMITNNSKTLFS
jgi:type I restriction-modification system DNA methylase subunit